MQGADGSTQRTASLNLEFTEIKAPLAGRIDRRLVSVGNLVQPDSTLLTTIVALDPIDFYFDIDERLLLQPTPATRSQRGGTMQEGAGGLDVVVARRRPQRKPYSRASSTSPRTASTTRPAPCGCAPGSPTSDGVLQPGMFGRINVPGSLPHQGILVPDEAIGADQDRRIVYVVDDDRHWSRPSRCAPGPSSTATASSAKA